MTFDEKSKPRKGSKVSYNATTLLLDHQQWRWLDEMTVEHKLPLDAGTGVASKAFRCCINCVALGDSSSLDKEEQTSIADESDMQEKSVELSDEQLQWLRTRANDESSLSEIARHVVKSCMATDQQTVFGVIRCKSSIARCEGAQGALKNIQSKYGGEESDVAVKENIELSS